MAKKSRAIDRIVFRLLTAKRANDNAPLEDGGPGSGNHNHAGRPGEVGGSAPAEGGVASSTASSKSRPIPKEEFSQKGYVGLSGEESDAFMAKYHNKQLIGSREANTMLGSMAVRINRALRNGEMPSRPEDVKMVERLDKGVSRNHLPFDMTLFRGMQLDAFANTGVFDDLELEPHPKMDDYQLPNGDVDYEKWGKELDAVEKRNAEAVLKRAEQLVGTTMVDNGFMHTSASSERNIFGWMGIGLQIHAPEGLNAYISNYAMESEIILGRGTRLRIVDAKIGDARVKDATRPFVQLICEVVTNGNDSETAETRDCFYLTDEGDFVADGGPGSGNHNHAGRPGQVGGSAPAGEVAGSVAQSASKPRLESPDDAIRTVAGEHNYTDSPEYIANRRIWSKARKRADDLKTEFLDLNEQLKKEVVMTPELKELGRQYADLFDAYTDKGREIKKRLAVVRDDLSQAEHDEQQARYSLDALKAKARADELKAYKRQPLRPATQTEYEGFTTETDVPYILELLENGKAWVAEMSPKEYLERCAFDIFDKGTLESTAAAVDITNVNKYADQMEAGEQFAVPYLNYSSQNQEGRHRALAAMLNGYDKIPVVIVGKPDPTAERPKVDPARFIPKPGEPGYSRHQGWNTKRNEYLQECGFDKADVNTLNWLIDNHVHYAHSADDEMAKFIKDHPDLIKAVGEYEAAAAKTRQELEAADLDRDMEYAREHAEWLKQMWPEEAEYVDRDLETQTKRYEREKKKLTESPMLYRKGGYDSPVLSFTTKPEGTTLYAGTEHEENLIPDHQASLDDLMKQGIIPVSGFGAINNFYGESEVTFVNVNAESPEKE